MSPPTAEEQLRFLTNLQRLLAEGQFVATYKYALLLALADIAVEYGDDSGDSLKIQTKQIAEKFIQYYWRQCVPYLPRVDPASDQILRQNTGRQAAIINLVREMRQRSGDSLAKAQRNVQGWKRLVQEVDQVVRNMPLWRLQTIGISQFDFLYENRRRGTTIELRPGVTYCLRQFYELIDDLVRGAWVRYIRRHNQDTLGTTTDLVEFLFGSERSNLSTVREILKGVQARRCFYCERPLPQQDGHVDHFIPWAKYPADLGHNFVLAHAGCNSAKADHLAAADYLEAWIERNVQFQTYLADEFTRYGVLHDLPTSVHIANWAYQQTFNAGGLTWRRSDELVPLPINWQRPLLTLLELPY